MKIDVLIKLSYSCIALGLVLIIFVLLLCINWKILKIKRFVREAGKESDINADVVEETVLLK